MQYIRCQQCGHMFSRVEIELCKFSLLGYRPGMSIFSCIRCAPLDKFGSPILFEKPFSPTEEDYKIWNLKND
jgi:hypothetical protein